MSFVLDNPNFHEGKWILDDPTLTYIPGVGERGLPLSASMINNLGFGVAPTTFFTLGGTAARDFTGIATGLIRFSDFYPDAPPLISWQLSTGNYVDRVVDPELIFPRPDSETPAWAKHRRHHPSVPYRIPIGVSFGSWPFYFEAISMPTGATVGSWLTTSGDKLIVGDDYGVVEWDNPTAGNHSFHIRVHFQDGYAPLDVQWTLEVTTAGTIFIDAVSGNDSTGDGTIGNPFQTCDAWWKDDLTDITYSQYQVCYRGGTHNPAVANTSTGVSGSNWRLMDNDKPLVHYGFGGESVVFDMSNTTIILGYSGGQSTGPDGSDSYFGNIIFDGSQSIDNPKQFAVYGDSHSPTEYVAGGGGQRMTWFETTHRNFTNTMLSNDNAGILWATNPGIDKHRHYWLMSGITTDNYKEENAGVNFNGFFVACPYNHLVENTKVINCEFGRGVYAIKSSGFQVCQRNVDYAQSPADWDITTVGSYNYTIGGNHEFSYCRLPARSDESSSLILLNDGFDTYDSGNANHLPVYFVRNTFNYDTPETNWKALIRSGDNWPFYMYGNFCQVDDMWYDLNNRENVNSTDVDDFVQVPAGSNALDVSLGLQGAYRTSYLGQFGAEIAE